MDTLGKRLYIIRKKTLNISRKKFIEGLDIGADTLENYEKDLTSPDANFFTRLMAKYHKANIDIDWLLFGKEATKYLSAEATPVLGTVPAGFPEDVVEEDILEYISLPDTPKEAYALVIDGSSMAPDIKDGNHVIFLPTERCEVLPGDIVIVNNEFGQSMVKRYVMKDGKPYLKSDNPEYPTFEPNEHYRIVGKVIDVWSRKKIRRAT